MTYSIVFTQSARDEARSAAQYITDEGSPAAANAWLDGLVEAVNSLSEHPHRCGYARENAAHQEAELRQLLFKSHRVIYTVVESDVFVLHVLHQRQDELDEV